MTEIDFSTEATIPKEIEASILWDVAHEHWFKDVTFEDVTSFFDSILNQKDVSTNNIIDQHFHKSKALTAMLNTMQADPTIIPPYKHYLLKVGESNDMIRDLVFSNISFSSKRAKALDKIGKNKYKSGDLEAAYMYCSRARALEEIYRIPDHSKIFHARTMEHLQKIKRRKQKDDTIIEFSEIFTCAGMDDIGAIINKFLTTRKHKQLSDYGTENPQSDSYNPIRFAFRHDKFAMTQSIELLERLGYSIDYDQKFSVGTEEHALAMNLFFYAFTTIPDNAFVETMKNDVSSEVKMEFLMFLYSVLEHTVPLFHLIAAKIGEDKKKINNFDKVLKQKEDTIKRQQETIEELKHTVEHLKAKQSDVDSQIRLEVDKAVRADRHSQAEDLKQIIEIQRQEINRYIAQNEELRKHIPKQVSMPTFSMNEDEELAIYLKELPKDGITVLGGKDHVVERLKKYFPDWIYISPSLSTKDMNLPLTDTVVCLYTCISHKAFIHARKRGPECNYIYASHNSILHIRRAIYQYFAS